MRNIKTFTILLLMTGAALITAPVQAKDSGPYSNFNFTISMGGTTLGGFTEVSGLATETEVVEYREGGDPEGTARKIPGLHKVSDITLKRGVISGNTDLWNWRQLVLDGDMDSARRNGKIIMHDQDMQPVAIWEFENAWPSKVEVHTERAADGNDLSLEELTITHEYIVRIK